MIKGQSRNVALTPVPYPGLDPLETVIPNVIEISNGRITDAGMWTKRPGMGLYALTDQFQPIWCLVPMHGGIAVNERGRVYRLTPAPATAVPPNQLSGSYRPTWAPYTGNIVFADGGKPMRLDVSANTLTALEGGPPPGRFVSVLDSYLLLGGHNGLEFRWSDTNDFKTWPAENVNYLIDEGETFEMMVVFKRRLWFFKSQSIEVWAHVGGDSTFIRQAVIDRGTPSGHSVVLANDNLYFLGDDGFFYVVDGVTPRQIPVRARDQLRGVIERVKNRTNVIGHFFPKEHMIRWTCPVEGLTLSYDLKNDVFLQDYEWLEGGPQRLRVNCAALFPDGEMYVGEVQPTGRVLSWSDQFPDDLGEPIRVQRVFTVALSNDGTTVRINRLRLRVLRGQGVPSPAPFGIGGPEKAAALIRWRFDQGIWGPYQELDLGAVGETDPYLDLHRLGVGREVTFDIVETDSVKYLLTHAHLLVENLGR